PGRHELDIGRAVARRGHLAGRAADGAVAYFTKMLPYVVGKKAGAADGATVVFDVSGRTVPIEVTGGRARQCELAPTAEPTVRVAMDTATFAALVNGRTNSTDGVKVEGDAELAQRVLSNMAVMV
ncbi:MAG: hypothetical protein QOE35_1707, partial [Actinomycetota bacterium]